MPGDADTTSATNVSTVTTAETTSTAAENAVVEIPSQLAEAMSPGAVEVLRERKKAKAVKAGATVDGGNAAAAGAVVKDAGTGAAGEVSTDSSTSTTGKDEVVVADGVDVIDLSGAAVAGGQAAAGDDGSGEVTPNTEGLPDDRKAEFLELHRDKAKIRKRAQDAEKERDELRTKYEASVEHAKALENRPEGFSNNAFAQFTDAKLVDAWKQDALKQIHLILDREAESKVHKRLDGTEINFAEVDEVEALEHARHLMAEADAWHQQRTVHAEAVTKAEPIKKAFEKVPQYAEFHAELAKLDPVVHRPHLVALAAAAKLLQTGEYQLVKKSRFAKAAGATSPAPVVSGAQENTANTTTAKAAPSEVRNAVPPAARDNGGGGSLVIPSELEERARKGDQDALTEMVRLKYAARGKQRAA
jgi:hypothetical protein